MISVFAKLLVHNAANILNKIALSFFSYVWSKNPSAAKLVSAHFLLWEELKWKIYFDMEQFGKGKRGDYGIPIIAATQTGWEKV